MATQQSRWDDIGITIPATEAKYTAGEQPVAEYDNKFNYDVTVDLGVLFAFLNNATYMLKASNLTDVVDAAASFSNIKQDATSTTTGVAELATLSEVNSGTDTSRIVTPDTLAGSYAGAKTIIFKVIPDNQLLTVGDGQARFIVPAVLNGMNLVVVDAHVYTVSSSGLPAFQIHNVTDSVDMLSTAITIDVSENDSKDAATPAVINTANDDVTTCDELRLDCDVSGTGTKGMEIRMIFILP